MEIAAESLQQKFEEEEVVLEARFPDLGFDYRDPVMNFDRRKVLGVAAKLFHIRGTEENIDFSMALETAVGF